MTLSTEQCIEVAENVWGWKFQSHEPIEGTDSLIRTNVQEWVGLTGLRNDVKSWQGFGRTVEAMAKTDLTDEEKFRYHLFLLDIGKAGREKTVEQYIEAIHLAALEAVNSSKK